MVGIVAADAASPLGGSKRNSSTARAAVAHSARESVVVAVKRTCDVVALAEDSSQRTRRSRETECHRFLHTRQRKTFLSLERPGSLLRLEKEESHVPDTSTGELQALRLPSSLVEYMNGAVVVGTPMDGRLADADGVSGRETEGSRLRATDTETK